MMRSSLAPVVGALFFIAGCAAAGNTPKKSDDAGDATDGMQQSLCSPGATQSCFCLGAGQGTQVCRADGKSYGSCTGCTGDGGIVSFSDMPAGNPCGDCDGCCYGTTCVTYQNQSNSECGVAGTVCGACSEGQVCDGAGGMCVTATTGCTSCGNGCCGTSAGGTANDTCFVNSPGQCGTGGGACTACAHGTLCANGACNNMIDPMTQFRVVVSATQIYNTDSSGSCWDYLAFDYDCEQPDLQVCFAYDAGSGLVAGCTTTINDVPPDNNETPSDPSTTDTGNWDSTDGLISSGGQTFYIPGSAFTTGKVLLYVQDSETFSTNLIGSTYLAAQTNYYTGYVVSNFQRVLSVNFSLQ